MEKKIMQNNNSIVDIEKLFSLQSLQAITEKISSLIKYDIVIVNHNGVIIAASRKSRIGIYNAKVKEMIETNAEMHIVYNEEDGDGFLPGINFPIWFEDTIIASVGITGNPADVKIFGRIIQSLVQQQLLDLIHEKEKANRRQILNSFVYDWIFQTPYLDADEFEIRASSLNINISSPRILAVVRIVSGAPADAPDNFLIQMQQNIADWLRFQDRQHVIALLGNEIVVLLNTDNSDRAEKTMNNVHALALSSQNVRLAIGIGMPFHNQDEARLTYEAAKLACKTAEESPSRSVCMFSSFDFRLLISSISKPIRQQIFNSVYRNFTSDSQISADINLLRSYVKNNRSISQTADELFLHKNTVQAQLNRIYDRTGYNPRDTKDLTLLYATTIMYEMGIRLNKSIS